MDTLKKYYILGWDKKSVHNDIIESVFHGFNAGSVIYDITEEEPTGDYTRAYEVVIAGNFTEAARMAVSIGHRYFMGDNKDKAERFAYAGLLDLQYLYVPAKEIIRHQIKENGSFRTDAGFIQKNNETYEYTLYVFTGTSRQHAAFAMSGTLNSCLLGMFKPPMIEVSDNEE